MFTSKRANDKENGKELIYFGNCTEDEVIESLFGDATEFAGLVEKHGDEFELGDLVVKYDEERDIHEFYKKETFKKESNHFYRKELSILHKALSNLKLIKESAYLAQLQHPDWKDDWEYPKESEEDDSKKLLDKVYPKTGLIKKLRTEYPTLEGIKLADFIESNGVKILSFSPNEKIGKGSYGTVYDGIFNGKEVAVKLQINNPEIPNNASNDFSNIRKIKSQLKNFPEFVKKIFPEFYLEKEELISGKLCQLIVIERLYPLAKEIKNSISGNNIKDKFTELLPEFLDQINEIMESIGIPYYTEKEIIDLLGGTESINSASFGKVKMLFIKSINDSKESRETKLELINTINAIMKSFKEKLDKTIPRWNTKYTKNDFAPTRDIEEFWYAIKWLRENEVPAGDINATNTMINKNGDLKIADFGAFYL